MLIIIHFSGLFFSVVNLLSYVNDILILVLIFGVHQSHHILAWFKRKNNCSSIQDWHRRFAEWWLYSKNKNFPKHFFTSTSFVPSYNGMSFHCTMQRRNHVFATYVFKQNKYHWRIPTPSQPFFHQMFLPKTPFVLRKIVGQYHNDFFAFRKRRFNFTTPVSSNVKLSIRNT